MPTNRTNTDNFSLRKHHHRPVERHHTGFDCEFRVTMRDSASEFCQRPAMRLGFVLRGGDAGVAVGQLGGAAVAVVDGDDPLDVVQLGGDREKIRSSEAIRPSECPFSSLHCVRPLLKKGNLAVQVRATSHMRAAHGFTV